MFWHGRMEHDLLFSQDERDMQAWRDRLEAINRELLAMDATDEFCREFLQAGGGICERVVGKRCVKHRGCRGPLPVGKMCAVEFGQRVVELRKQVVLLSAGSARAFLTVSCFQAADVESERGRLRREWDRLRAQERNPDATAQVVVDRAFDLGWLLTAGCAQELLEQRKEDVKNELLHKQKERLDLMWERLQVLGHDPVDTSLFHNTLTGLLNEKIGLLELLKLGLPPAGDGARP